MKKYSKLRMIIAIICFIFAFSIRVNASGELIDIKVNGSLDYTKAQEVLTIVNEERRKQGLNELQMDNELMESAMIRAMEIGVFFDHTRPNGTSCFTVSSKAFGENIAAGSSTASGTMDQWMTSDGHRANILRSNYKSIGIGVFKNGSIYYWVQIFGTSSASVVSNKTGSVDIEKGISILKDNVSIYGHKVLSWSAYEGIFEGQSGYFKYGVTNKGWDYTYSPGVPSDYNIVSSNNKVISIDNEGNFKALSKGTAMISICLKADSTKCYVETITVQENLETRSGVYYNTYTGYYEVFKNGQIDYDFTGLNNYNGKWFYFKDGISDYTYTGLASNSNGTYYVENGSLTFKYNGTYKDSTGNVYVIKNSKVNTSFTGLKKVSGEWYYFKKGKTDLTYTGLVSNSNGTYYVQKGILTFKYNGTYKDSTGNIYVIKNSTFDTSYKGLKSVSGKWYYFKNGKTDFTYTGYASNSNGTFYVEKGIITFKFNKLVKYKGKWTAIVASKVQSKYTGLSTNKNGTYMLIKGTLSFKYNAYHIISDGNIYILKNSKVDSSFTGLKKVDGVWLYFKKGVTDYNYTGYVSNSNGTFYVEKGEVTFKYNRLVKYKGKWTAIVASKVQPNFTGISTNNNGSYYLEKGNLTFKYNGKITYKGKVYTIKNSKVVK